MALCVVEVPSGQQYLRPPFLPRHTIRQHIPAFFAVRSGFVAPKPPSCAVFVNCLKDCFVICDTYQCMVLQNGWFYPDCLCLVNLVSISCSISSLCDFILQGSFGWLVWRVHGTQNIPLILFWSLKLNWTSKSSKSVPVCTAILRLNFYSFQWGLTGYVKFLFITGHQRSGPQVFFWCPTAHSLLSRRSCWFQWFALSHSYLGVSGNT